MNLYLKMVLYGVLLWVVPYALSMGLYPSGIMTTDYNFFKTIMTLSATAVATIASIYFARSESKRKNFTIVAWTTVLVWMIVNWLLDFAFLLPYMPTTTLAVYFSDIGLSYLAAAGPILAIAYTRK